MMLRVLLVLGFALAGAPVPSPASESAPAESSATTGSLRLTLLTPDGHALAGATVWLTQLSSRLTLGPLTANDEGQLIVPNLAPGDWHWQATTPNGLAGEGVARVDAGAPLVVAVQLSHPISPDTTRPILDFGNGVLTAGAIDNDAFFGKKAATPLRDSTQLSLGTTSAAAVGTTPTGNEADFSLPASRSATVSVTSFSSGKVFTSLNYEPPRAAVGGGYTLADFNGAASNGSVIPGTTWEGVVTQNAGGNGLLVVGAGATSVQGWGYTFAAPIDLSVFDTVTLTGRQESGNSAQTVSILFFQGGANSAVTNLEVSFFSTGGAMGTSSSTINWGSLDKTQITGWSVGGNFPFADVDFRMSFDSIVLTTAIPEPSTYAGLAGLGALALAFWHRRRRAAK